MAKRTDRAAGFLRQAVTTLESNAPDVERALRFMQQAANALKQSDDDDDQDEDAAASLPGFLDNRKTARRTALVDGLARFARGKNAALAAEAFSKLESIAPARADQLRRMGLVRTPANLMPRLEGSMLVFSAVGASRSAR